MQIYRLAPPTTRDAYRLSGAYGYDSIDALAQDLPDDALVYDIGAGGSRFGHSVATIRPDVQWGNVDRRYDEESLLGQIVCRQIASQSRLPNLRYIPADMIDPFDNQQMPTNTADRVFCSSVLPHILMASRMDGERAVHNMARLLKSTGVLSITGLFDHEREAIHITAEDYKTAPEQAVSEVVKFATLSPSQSVIQRGMNLSQLRANPDDLRNYDQQYSD